jgi:glyoxylase-like metal-dependent hydrolase (beta-lactamase superfamily II)/rhodanese-related sulfurtransferase
MNGGEHWTDGGTSDGDARATVSPDRLDELLRAGERLTVLDVRDRDEFDSWHITGPAVEAVQVPHAKFIQAGVTDSVADLATSSGVDSGDRVLVVCARGEASAQVAGQLDDAGFDAANLDSGMEGWARLLVAEPVPTETATVVQYRRPSSGCLSYLVVGGAYAAVIDPLRSFADRYVEDAADRSATVSYAVDTHVHADHVSGVRAVAERTGAEPVFPSGAAGRGLDFDATLDGHLFCGDSVFADAVARPDLEAGDEGAPALARTLHATLRDVVLSLPDETVLLPGHYDDPSEASDGPVAPTVGEVRDRVPALSMDEDAFVAFVTENMSTQPANFERIVDVNLGHETVDDGTAFELELGPNNCAVG